MNLKNLRCELLLNTGQTLGSTQLWCNSLIDVLNFDAMQAEFLMDILLRYFDHYLLLHICTYAFYFILALSFYNRINLQFLILAKVFHHNNTFLQWKRSYFRLLKLSEISDLCFQVQIFTYLLITIILLTIHFLLNVFYIAVYSLRSFIPPFIKSKVQTMQLSMHFPVFLLKPQVRQI